MSICVLQGLSRKITKRAFILAQAHNTKPTAACTAPLSQLLINIKQPVRFKHDQEDLYQWVKKRTLEARTKKQIPTNPTSATAPIRPGQKSPPCIVSTSLPDPKEHLSLTTGSISKNKAQQGNFLPARSPSASINKPAFGRSSSYDQASTACAELEPTQRDGGIVTVSARLGNTVSYEVSASGDPCNNAKRPPTAPTGCKTGAAAPPPEDSSKSNLWLALLVAGLLGGGLLWWYSSQADEDEITIVDMEATPPNCSYAAPTVPASSADLPRSVPYLLIGGGTASFSAFRAIKSADPKAKVLIITNEHRLPYMRPPLSKELWYSSKCGKVEPDLRFKQWTGAERSLYFEPNEFFVPPDKLMDMQNGGVAVARGFTVKKIDPERRSVQLDDGSEICYGQCLIATGCTPKNLSVFENAPYGVKEKVMVYRTPEDFERLKEYADQGKSIAIIGSGFTGSELACSLANYAQDKEIKIYQIFPETGNMSKILPDYLSKWTTQKVRAQGVQVIPKAEVRGVKRDNDIIKLELSNGQVIVTDVAVVCVGCDPNTQLARTSGLEVCSNLGGFTVNAELEARRNLYVAGDASCFYDPLLGRRRVEHHDHSVVSGRLAGENMASNKKKPYKHQSMFWSDLGPDIGYEGIGLVDSSLPTVGVFALSSDNNNRTNNLEPPPSSTDSDDDNSCEAKPPVELAPKEKAGGCQKDDSYKCKPEDANNYGRGVIFYLKNDKVVGVLLWNLFNRVGLARMIINQNKKYDDLNEVAKLFEIHS